VKLFSRKRSVLQQLGAEADSLIEFFPGNSLFCSSWELRQAALVNSLSNIAAEQQHLPAEESGRHLIYVWLA
jgi:hypothetical protein